jgi:TRAP-type C4-dicarboxylate transport system permease small subunit
MVNRVLAVVENSLAAAAFMVITAVALVNVISRYFLNASLAFTSEITINLAVWMTMIGAAIAVRERAHLGFSLLHDRVRGRLRDAVTIVIAVVMVLFLLVIAVYGWEQVVSQFASGRATPSMGIPQWWFSLALPVGAVLAIIRAVQVAVATIRAPDEDGHLVGIEGGPVL